MNIKDFFKNCTKGQKLFFVVVGLWILTCDFGNLSFIGKINCVIVPITLIAIIRNKFLMQD